MIFHGKVAAILCVFAEAVHLALGTECQVTDWSQWGQCRGTCLFALRVRNRDVKQPAFPELSSPGGVLLMEPCPPLYQVQQCSPQYCVDGGRNLTGAFSPTFRKQTPFDKEQEHRGRPVNGESVQPSLLDALTGNSNAAPSPTPGISSGTKAETSTASVSENSTAPIQEPSTSPVLETSTIPPPPESSTKFRKNGEILIAKSEFRRLAVLDDEKELGHLSRQLLALQSQGQEKEKVREFTLQYEEITAPSIGEKREGENLKEEGGELGKEEQIVPKSWIERHDVEIDSQMPTPASAEEVLSKQVPEENEDVSYDQLPIPASFPTRSPSVKVVIFDNLRLEEDATQGNLSGNSSRVNQSSPTLKVHLALPIPTNLTASSSEEVVYEYTEYVDYESLGENDTRNSTSLLKKWVQAAGEPGGNSTGVGQNLKPEGTTDAASNGQNSNSESSGSVENPDAEPVTGASSTSGRDSNPGPDSNQDPTSTNLETTGGAEPHTADATSSATFSFGANSNLDTVDSVTSVTDSNFSSISSTEASSNTTSGASAPNSNPRPATDTILFPTAPTHLPNSAADPAGPQAFLELNFPAIPAWNYQQPIRNESAAQLPPGEIIPESTDALVTSTPSFLQVSGTSVQITEKPDTVDQQSTSSSDLIPSDQDIPQINPDDSLIITIPPSIDNSESDNTGISLEGTNVDEEGVPGLGQTSATPRSPGENENKDQLLLPVIRPYEDIQAKVVTIGIPDATNRTVGIPLVVNGTWRGTTGQSNGTISAGQTVTFAPTVFISEASSRSLLHENFTTPLTVGSTTTSVNLEGAIAVLESTTEGLESTTADLGSTTVNLESATVNPEKTTVDLTRTTLKLNGTPVDLRSAPTLGVVINSTPSSSTIINKGTENATTFSSTAPKISTEHASSGTSTISASTSTSSQSTVHDDGMWIDLLNQSTPPASDQKPTELSPNGEDGEEDGLDEEDLTIITSDNASPFQPPIPTSPAPVKDTRSTLGTSSVQTVISPASFSGSANTSADRVSGSLNLSSPHFTSIDPTAHTLVPFNGSNNPISQTLVAASNRSNNPVVPASTVSPFLLSSTVPEALRSHAGPLQTLQQSSQPSPTWPNSVSVTAEPLSTAQSLFSQPAQITPSTVQLVISRSTQITPSPTHSIVSQTIGSSVQPDQSQANSTIPTVQPPQSQPNKSLVFIEDEDSVPISIHRSPLGTVASQFQSTEFRPVSRASSTTVRLTYDSTSSGTVPSAVQSVTSTSIVAPSSPSDTTGTRSAPLRATSSDPNQTKKLRFRTTISAARLTLPPRDTTTSTTVRPSTGKTASHSTTSSSTLSTVSQTAARNRGLLSSVDQPPRSCVDKYGNKRCCRLPSRARCPGGRLAQQVMRWHRHAGSDQCISYSYGYCGYDLEEAERPIKYREECYDTCYTNNEKKTLPIFDQVALRKSVLLPFEG